MKLASGYLTRVNEYGKLFKSQYLCVLLSYKLALTTHCSHKCLSHWSSLTTSMEQGPSSKTNKSSASQKLSTFYETRRHITVFTLVYITVYISVYITVYITMFTTARYWSLS
jgi:hypothetical protein